MLEYSHRLGYRLKVKQSEIEVCSQGSWYRSRWSMQSGMRTQAEGWVPPGCGYKWGVVCKRGWAWWVSLTLRAIHADAMYKGQVHMGDLAHEAGCLVEGQGDVVVTRV